MARTETLVWRAKMARTMITADELWELGPEAHYELLKGELRPMAPTGEDHGFVAANIVGFLVAHVRPKRLGRVYSSETGFRVELDSETVLAPDAAFVQKSRVVPSRKYYQGAPDLAVEVISPSESHAGVEEKVQAYLEAGVRAVVIVNPVRQTVSLWRSPKEMTLLGQGDVLDLSNVVDGFSIAVDELFSDE
jgi:Uma2 family endonuclease